MRLVGYKTHLIYDLLIVSKISQIFRSSCSLKELLDADLRGLVIRGEQGKIVLVVAHDVFNVRLTTPSLSKPVLEGFEATFGRSLPNRICFCLNLIRSVRLKIIEGDGGKLTTHYDLLKIRNLL